jgi:hypothetical protein
MTRNELHVKLVRLIVMLIAMVSTRQHWRGWARAVGQMNQRIDGMRDEHH